MTGQRAWREEASIPYDPPLSGFLARRRGIVDALRRAESLRDCCSDRDLRRRFHERAERLLSFSLGVLPA